MYYSWINMKTRCFNKNNEKYRSYGGRGITVEDPRWMKSKFFIEDMQSTWFEGATIERINVNKGYYKQNCKWIHKSEQYKNKQKKVFRYKGESMTEAAKRLGLKNSDCIRDRIHRFGWTVKDAFTIPKERKQRYIYGKGN